MPASKRGPTDPRLRLIRLVDRLGDRQPFVTLEAVERAAARPSARLATEGLAELVEAAVQESLLLKDLRTFFDRTTNTYSQAWVYRVNARHPLAQQLLDG